MRPLGETPEQRAEKLATVAAVGTTIEQIQKHAAQEKAALVAELEAARKHEREAIADTVLATALKAAKVTDTAADLIAQKLLPRVNIETKDGKRAVAIMSADGTTPMVNADGKPAGFADLMREAQTAWPDCFEGTGAGGGGTNPKQKGPAASKVLTRAEFDRLSPKEKSDKMLGGWKLTDN
ncbi:MAG: hypothetical protein K9G60_01880 [Pseudolabrys sp.]|nr:hypothetical protein [Pseudolabrys sp.]